MDFKVVINRREPGIFSVTLFGPLDSVTHVKFEKEITPLLIPSTKAIILNMDGVDYMSSLGIGSFFKVSNYMNRNNGSLLMTNLQPQIKKLLETVKALPPSVFKSIEEADEYINEIQRKAIGKDKDKPFAF